MNIKGSNPLEKLTRIALDHPRKVIAFAIILTAAFAFQFRSISIDTDPENMLEPDQSERVFYNSVKRDFGVHDLIVVGLVDQQGIFRPDSLQRISRATAEILKIPGVIIPDVVSLTTTDNITSAGGLLDIHPVMGEVPQNPAESSRLRAEMAENPFLHEKLASTDGTGVALYIPIREKNQSYRIAQQIQSVLKDHLLPGQSYHLAGLPVAEDTFGHQMFLQMAVTAPLAFCCILLLVFLLFRKSAFLLPIGLDAMLAVIWAMGLLIGTGHTVHIMSSMIPVFLMPIAITDDIHVLSAFYDRYRETGDKRRALLEGMVPLYRPMLFTSLTTAAGFASLALTDIPPVRVFGLFVAFGIIAAWLFSMTVVPATVSLMSEERLRRSLLPPQGDSAPLLDRLVRSVGRFAFARYRLVLLLGMALLLLGVLGVQRIQVNDNPVRWFKEAHPIRLADSVVNRLFGGTYMAYLVIEGERPEQIKQPDVMAYIAQIQTHLERDELVGKTSSVADIVKRINLVLHDGDRSYHEVPERADAIGQFLFLFQSSGDPDDLDNFIDYDAQRANVWVQLKGGDNQQMSAIERRLDEFLAFNPPPSGLKFRWSGLTYINRIWQDLMVVGMLKAVLGSFVVVFLLMLLQFRSLWMAALAMLPLSLAILLSYGLIGWVGKDYDMPIAVCSSLALGLAVDYAIHFLDRFRKHYRLSGDLGETNEYMFGEPGRAIGRNAVVISLGFLPLMLSSLTPYVTVGLFFATLMLFSTIATLLLLPAILRAAGRRIAGRVGV
ncbi:MAG: MMPL family transporter [Bryobacteraceae bacterium]|nr:MMPL family transporter [Bryobacteraceae bacterium]